MRDRWIVPAEENGSAEEKSSFAQELEDAKTVADFFGGWAKKSVDQRERLDTRTSLIVTSSGGLIAVVGVVAALLPKQDQNYRYPSVLVIALIGAIVLFLAAVLVAQAAALDVGVRRKTDHIADRIDSLGGLIALAALNKSAAELQHLVRANSDATQALYKANSSRRRRLKYAGTCQLAGILGLGCALAVFVWKNFA